MYYTVEPKNEEHGVEKPFAIWDVCHDFIVYYVIV